MNTGAVDGLQDFLDRALRGRRSLEVLEAGCGSASHLRFPAPVRLTGIDVEPRQLERNAALHTRILGDIQSYRWPAARFDVVVCWDVLEHVPDPRAAVCNLAGALAADGFLVIAVPHLYSIKGIMTKLTPWTFHVWFYRNVMGDHRDPSEWNQFPTWLRADVAPDRLRRTAQSLGLETAWTRLYEGPVQQDLRERHKVADLGFRAADLFGRLATSGRWQPTTSDCLLVFRKPAGAYGAAASVSGSAR